ncbi:trypsin-like peptidase domain-containing protein [Nocardioides soli]|uniref:Putative serine protease PepD n=1 Tax=Nocardioides soli TaxID=1036020 RepID=A0A7W4VT77_9ACTN|nr:putative serine protease PepD [Nocardioides soli]
MSHDDAPAGPEPTRPLPFPPPAGPAPTWVPPTTQAPPYPPAWHLPAPAPAHPPRHAQVRGRVPGWVWPVVCLLALVVGTFGGLVGGVAYERIQDDQGTVSGGLSAVDTVSEPPLPLDNGSIAAVAQKLLPSTVQVIAEFKGEAGGATGSGFVLDRQGHIVTNNHVVADAADDDGPIEVVAQDGNRYDATIVGRSPVYDLAVLYVQDARRMTPAALGTAEGLVVGEGVVAIGSPLGLSSTVTAGIVSALHRPVTTGDSGNESSYINAVQTDAAINPGNSGGPLVNLRGQVVGVNSAIATTGGMIGGESGNIGVGFAIPIEQVKVTADQILRTGEARYPVIGAQVRTGATGGSGAEIDSVMPDTPAEDGGLRKGDVITAVDGSRVTDGIALIVAIRTHQPGEKVEFTVVRDGKERTVELTLDGEVG